MADIQDIQKKDDPVLQQDEAGIQQKVIEAIRDVVSHVPASSEPVAAHPAERSRSIILLSSSKAAALSAGLSLPPGPIGLLTILPDLLGIWRIQQQMVADIAAAHGVEGRLNQEQMLYCLFRHAASQAVRDLAVRVGQRIIVRRASLKVMQAALEKVGIKVTQRVLGRAASRWIPILGAAAVGAYAFHDTRQVGRTALELFGGEAAHGDPA